MQSEPTDVTIFPTGDDEQLLGAYPGWKKKKIYNIGVFVTYKGSDYESLVKHRSSVKNAPDVAPTIWEKLVPGPVTPEPAPAPTPVPAPTPLKDMHDEPPTYMENTTVVK